MGLGEREGCAWTSRWSAASSSDSSSGKDGSLMIGKALDKVGLLRNELIVIKNADMDGTLKNSKKDHEGVAFSPLVW